MSLRIKEVLGFLLITVSKLQKESEFDQTGKISLKEQTVLKITS